MTSRVSRLARVCLKAVFAATCVVCAATAQAQSADLVLNHSDSPDPGPAGGIFTYTLRIDNNGPNTATGIALTDTIPTGATFVSAVPSVGTCSQNNGQVTCATLGDLPFTSPVTSFVTVAIRVRLPTAGVYTNTAGATSTTPDPNATNNDRTNATCTGSGSCLNTTTVVAAADLAIAATASAANVTAGQNFTYRLVATNNGPDALPSDGSQTISFAVPSGASITAAPSGTGWSCVPVPAGGYPRSSGSLTCTRAGGLANGSSTAPLTVPAVANVAGTVSAAFAVAGFKNDGSRMPDGDSTNDADTVDVSSTAGSDVGITKTRPSAVVAQNSNVSYTLTPRFYGGVAPGATGSGLITVTDTLDPSLAFVSASGPGWTCTGTPGNPTVTCTRPGPYAGGNFTNMPAITLVATATGLGSVPNTAAIAIPETDPDTANDTSTVNVTSTNEANLRVGKTGPGFPVAVGQTFNYTLPVTNDGPLAVGATQTITVVDPIPAGITVVAAPAAGSSATWICNTNGQTLTCQRTGALAANATSTLIVAARADVAGSTTNTVNCPSLSGTFPVSSTNPGNQCGSATVLATAVVDSADLQIQKAVVAGSETVIAGENLSYRLTVTNNGTAAATNVTVSDTLASLVGTGGFQSATPSQGACTPNNVTNSSSVALSCNLGTMGPNTTQSVLVVVRPSIADTGSRGNTATVNSPQVGDTDRTNNTSSVSSTVTAKVDIVALKTATPSTVPAGAPITYQASVRNDGPSTAQTVRLTDTLPANAAFMNLVSVSNGGSCTTVPAVDSVGGSLVCAWANVPNGQQYTATYRVRPLGTRTGAAYDAVVNNVAVTTATLETQTGNNSATTSTAVVAPQLDILVNKVDSIDPVELGQPTTYTVTISNGGPSYGTNLRMVDVFPAPGSAPSAVFSYRGALTVDNGGTCVEPAIGTTSGTLTCSFPGIASGAVATVTYQMRAESLTAAGSTSGTGFNKVTVQVNEVETQTANNDRTESTTTRRAQIATDLQITKSGPATGIAGGNLAYTLLVRNNGPLVSDGAQVRDALPAGTTFDSGAGCTEAGGTVTCLVGPLAVNATRSFAVTLKLANPYTGASPLSNTATVDAPGDTVPGNNNSTATTTVSAAPNATSVPTLSEWGVMLLSALVGVFALAARRRGLAG